MKVSARNQLAGTVKALNVGVVNAEVMIALPGGDPDRSHHHQKCLRAVGA